MLDTLPPNVKRIYIHTGNILTLNEVRKNVGQDPTDELIESLKITLRNWQPATHLEGDTVQVYHQEVEFASKMNYEDRKELKICVKIYLSSLKKESLHEALGSMFAVLNTSFIDSLVLAYPRNTSNLLQGLQELWTILEEYVKDQKLLSIGVSDIDTDVFFELYNWAAVKPSIVQINVASCCLVPPILQAFTKDHDVQILTHSDPFEILSKGSLREVFGGILSETSQDFGLIWALRIHIHVKCRSVLTTKGYILCLSRENSLVGEYN